MIKRIKIWRLIVLLLLLWEGAQGDSAQFQEGHGDGCGGWLNQLPSKPLSNKLRNEEREFLINTGTTYSVLNTCKGKFSHKSVDVGVTGQKENQPFLELLKFKLGKQWVTHQFLYMPKCPLPLLG